MGEKKAAIVVVRIGVRVGELVVHPMVAHPFVDAVLERRRLQCDQNHAQRPFRLVGAVRPQPVGAAGDADRTENAVQVA